VNTGTGTNGLDCRRAPDGTYNAWHSASSRSNMAKIEELADRVDRLILRHDELQRTNALLEQQLGAVTHERDSLRSRLNAARARIDALLDRLPAEPATSAAAVDGTGSAA
jgi:cell division protein ZapB